jgi:hypothetical protein
VSCKTRFTHTNHTQMSKQRRNRIGGMRKRIASEVIQNIAMMTKSKCASWLVDQGVDIVHGTGNHEGKEYRISTNRAPLGVLQVAVDAL